MAINKMLGNKMPGAFASLSSGLLARKGAAKPAMRPQGFGQMGASLEDLGWNDMGFEAPKPTVSLQERDADHDAFGDAFTEQPLRNPVAALTPSPVHGQQAELAQRLANADDADEPDEGDEEEAGTLADTAPLVLKPPVLRTAEAFVAAEPITVAEPVVIAEPVASAEPLASVEPEAAAPAPAVSQPQNRAGTAAGPKAAFTLRLDAPRHLRLRLACAMTGRSAQMLVTEAVDRLLAQYPELDTFADTLPTAGRTRRAKG